MPFTLFEDVENKSYVQPVPMLEVAHCPSEKPNTWCSSWTLCLNAAFTHMKPWGVQAVQRHACEVILVFLLYRAPLCHLQSWSQMVSEPPSPPKCQERAWVKALHSLSIQRMNSRGNLGARGHALTLGTISICWMASMSSGYSNRCFVGAFMEEQRTLVDRAAAASCKGKFCPVPWHHRHGLLCEVHPI